MTTSSLLVIPEIPDDRLPEVQAKLQTALDAVLVSMGVTDLSPQFKARSDALVLKAKACKQVQSADEEAAAAAVRKEISALEKELEAQTKALKGNLDAAGKAILELKRKGLDPIEAAKKRLTDMLAGYVEEQLAAQRKAAAEEAARIAAANAEAERLKAEAAKLEEQAKNVAPEKAAELDAKAQELIDEAEMAEMAEMSPAAPIPSIQHVSGSGHRMTWGFRIIGKTDTQQELAMIEMIKRGHGFFFKIEPRKSSIQDALKIDAKKFEDCKDLIEVFERPVIYGR